MSSPKPPPCSFAYLYERFPSFVQTFVYREAAEMVRQGMAPLLVSVRRPDEPAEVGAQVPLDAFYLPEEKELRAAVDARRAARKIGGKARRAIPQHRMEPDAQRMFEAIWLEPELRARGIQHVHAHFGGLAARTAWWLRELFGFTYSYTGHANDIFCDTEFPITNATLARDARFIVTETDHALRWIEKRHPFAKGKVFRVFNGIDIAGFPPREPAGPVPLIVTVGRYVEKKGFDGLIAACAMLRKRGINFSCEIIGTGPLQVFLAAHIERLGLSGQVRLVGAKSQEEVRRRLAAAELFVLACQPDSDGGSDNLPTAIAEAMVAGVPVISTKLAGVPEMIADGVDGLLVPVGDHHALCTAMAKLLTDRTLARQFAAHARTSAERKFAVQSTTRELKHLLVKHAGVQAPNEARVLDPELPRASQWQALRQRLAWR